MNNNSSTRKSVNRARKANGKGNKTRLAPSQQTSSQESKRGSKGNGPNVFAPIAMSRKQETVAPSMRYMTNGCLVKQRELISVVSIPSTQDGFAILKRLRLNPASSATFPWLSTIAGSYESFRFKKLHFEYITRAPSTFAGSVIMAPDYDAADGSPVTESVLSQYKGAVEDVPWKNMILIVQPGLMNRAYKAHFICDDGRFALTKQDVKTLDPGQFFLGCDGVGPSKWGKLWVDYEVELINPQSPTLGPSVGGSVIQFNNCYADNATTTQIFGTATTGNFQRVDVNDPIIDLNKTFLGPSSTVGTFLRDFKGVVDMSTGTGGTSNLNSTVAWTINQVRDGVTTILNSPIGVTAFGNNGNNSTVMRQAQAIDAKAGDVLQLGGLSATNLGVFSNFPVNLILSALSS